MTTQIIILCLAAENQYLVLIDDAYLHAARRPSIPCQTHAVTPTLISRGNHLAVVRSAMLRHKAHPRQEYLAPRHQDGQHLPQAPAQSNATLPVIICRTLPQFIMH
jgi:hypothetical protein